MHHFVSYSRADGKEFTIWLADELQAGPPPFRMWLYERQQMAGDAWDAQLEKAIHDCTSLVFIMTAESVRDTSVCKHEWVLARKLKKPLLLVRAHADVESPLLLGSEHIIDFSENRESGLAKLRQYLGHLDANEAPPAADHSQTRIGKETHAPKAQEATVLRVPHMRNPDFTGREEVFKWLCGHSQLPKPSTMRVQAIHGLPGVGKTQVALEYVYRYADEYNEVTWIRCEDAATRICDLSALAEELCLEGKDSQDQSITIKCVQDWLATNAGWLLVLDNVADPKDIELLLTGIRHGHVIITSRAPNWDGRAESLQLSTFDRDESVQFLQIRKSRTGTTGGEHSVAFKEEQSGGREPECLGDGTTIESHGSAGTQRLPVTVDESWMSDEHELADALGRLPLALAHAVAFVEATGHSFAEYLRLFRENQAKLLKKPRPLAGYDQTIFDTYDMSIRAVSRQSKPAEGLMSLCSFLSHDAIPRNGLLSLLGQLPELRGMLLSEDDQLDMDSALDELKTYSLVEWDWDDENLTIHPLVQAISRLRLEPNQHRKWAQAALRLVDAAFPLEAHKDPQTWPRCNRLLPHALSVMGHAETEFGRNAATNSESEALSRLLTRVGLYLLSRAHFTTAEPLLRNALAIDEQLHESNDPRLATSLNNLATLLLATNRPAEAEPMYRRALSIDEQFYGTDHPRVAADLDSLAQLLQATNRTPDAESLLRRALVINKNADGDKHPNVATRLNSLAKLLLATNHSAEAESLLERALAINEQAYGKNDRRVVRNKHNLAAVMKARHRLAEAEPLMREVLRVDELSYGASHPIVATDLNNLALLLVETNRMQEAESMHRRALAIDEQAFGTDHPMVARDLRHLAQLLQRMNHLKEAESLYRRAVAINKQAYGANHRSVGKDLYCLGLLLKQLDRVPEGDRVISQSFEIFRESDRIAHPDAREVFREPRE